MKQPICTIINFCTLEARFLTPLVENARLFSKQIIVPHCDHFFNGDRENLSLLEKIYHAFPDVRFVRFPLIQRNDLTGPDFLGAVARVAALPSLEKEIETLLFLDGDEIPDGRRFSEWLAETNLHDFDVVNFASYWYFREARYRALQEESQGTLIRRELATKERLLKGGERSPLADFVGQKIEHAEGLDKKPLIHHYSWVRSKEELLQKVISWGHYRERDWQAAIKEEFSRPFNGSDFVHGYSYKEVEPHLSLDLTEATFPPRGMPHLKVLSQEELSCLITS